METARGMDRRLQEGNNGDCKREKEEEVRERVREIEFIDVRERFVATH